MVSRYNYLEERIETVLNWADEHHPDFDTEFVESLKKQLEDRGSLSDKQEEALLNIIEKWNIGDWYGVGGLYTEKPTAENVGSRLGMSKATKFEHF